MEININIQKQGTSIDGVGMYMCLYLSMCVSVCL